MKDGIINLDTARGRTIGFTSDRFDGYLWKRDNVVIISFIVSYARGAFRNLVQRIQGKGFDVDVPTPLGRMQSIVRRHGVRRMEPFAPELDDNTPCEVWRLNPVESKP